LTTPKTLAEWLEFIERQHPAHIALGLDRVRQVLGRLGSAISIPVLTVAGTNGKGSTCAVLESVLRAARYRIGLYTSPHLMRYNERVRIDGREADDAALCKAFAAVESARGGVPLTYFEFGTLAATWLFARSRLDALVLEVGLGGRLDAVNAIDPDCAVLTSVAIDHVDYLGADREATDAQTELPLVLSVHDPRLEAVRNQLESIDPDHLSPREALDALYALRQLLDR